MSVPRGPEILILYKSRSTTFWLLSHLTPTHEHGVSWEAFQLTFTDLGAAHLLKSEIRACPSEFNANTGFNSTKKAPNNIKKMGFLVLAIFWVREREREGFAQMIEKRSQLTWLWRKS